MHEPIALYNGRPVIRSQTTVVSRWFVIPIATTQDCDLQYLYVTRTSTLDFRILRFTGIFFWRLL